MAIKNGNSGIIGMKTEMHDMGEMKDKMGEVALSQGNSKKEKYYPTTYLSSKKLPGIEDYDIGDGCKLCSINKVVGKREKKDGEVEVEVEIHEMGLMGKQVIAEEDYKDLSDDEKDKIDEKEVLGENE